jgi:protein-arginine kinase activator protein McsA
VARGLFQPLATCTGQKVNINAVTLVIERKVVTMANTPIQNSSTQRRSDICKRCGRKLKNPASIAVGFGTVCYKKFTAESLLKPLFKASRGEVEDENNR